MCTRHRSSSLVCGLLTLALVAACGEKEPPFTVDVLYQDVQGVERGDEVMFKGLEIGEVTDVGINSAGYVAITIEVDPEHRGALASNSRIEIERAGLLGGRQLTVRDGDGERTPLKSGDEIVGVEGPVASALTSLRALSENALQRVQDAGNDLQQRLAAAGEESDSGAEGDGTEAVDPDLQSELARLATALESLREQTAAATDEESRQQFEQRAEEFQQQLDVLRDKLRTESEALQQRLGPLLQDVESWWSDLTGSESTGEEDGGG